MHLSEATKRGGPLRVSLDGRAYDVELFDAAGKRTGYWSFGTGDGRQDVALQTDGADEFFFTGNAMVLTVYAAVDRRFEPGAPDYPAWIAQAGRWRWKPLPALFEDQPPAPAAEPVRSNGGGGARSGGKGPLFVENASGGRLELDFLGMAWTLEEGEGGVGGAALASGDRIRFDGTAEIRARRLRSSATLKGPVEAYARWDAGRQLWLLDLGTLFPPESR